MKFAQFIQTSDVCFLYSQDLVSLEVRMCQPSSNATLTESFGRFPAAADEATPADTADTDQPDLVSTSADEPSAADIELVSTPLSTLSYFLFSFSLFCFCLFR